MIEAHNLVKRFGGHTAVDGVSFTVGKGEVMGVLGPNGAGKSTTMKMLTCFIPPTAGEALVGGRSVHHNPLGVRELIGYLPESSATYPEMTVREFLAFVGAVRGFEGAELARRIDRVVELAFLAEVENQVIETLSKGYRQRTCLAQALIHDPPVLILDEPTDGLDPNQKHEMRQLIARMGEEKTIILSTHILEEMEAVCSRALIIALGKVVLDTTPEGMAAMSRWHQAVTLNPHQDDGGKLKADLEKLDGVAQVAYRPASQKEPAAYNLFPQKGKALVGGVYAFLEKKKLHMDQVYVERGRVDEVFRQLTQPGPAQPLAEKEGR